MGVQTASLEPGDLVEVAQVGGNLEVEGWLQPDVQVRGDHVQIRKGADAILITSSGNLVVSMPARTKLVLTSIGGNVRIQDMAGIVELQLVGGDVTLRNLTGQVRLGGPIGGETHLENVTNVSMKSAKASAGTDGNEDKRRKVAEAARRAVEKLKRAEHKALQHSQTRSHRFETGRWKYRAGPDTLAPVQPVSEEERVAVLRMLHDKKISAEQADQLLTALEGKE